MKTTVAMEVREALEAYISATRDGNGELLGALFDPGAVVAGYYGDEFLVRGPEGFIERATATPAGPGYVATVTEVSVIGETATGTVLEDGLWDGFSFVNKFHLIRDPGGAWVITAKLFHRD